MQETVMAPRPVGTLMSIITMSEDQKTINECFFQHLQEIFASTKMDITNNLIYLKLAQANELRAYLAHKLMESPKLVKEMTSIGLMHI